MVVVDIHDKMEILNNNQQKCLGPYQTSMMKLFSKNR